jgi:hypothetical protein
MGYDAMRKAFVLLFTVVLCGCSGHAEFTTTGNSSSATAGNMPQASSQTPEDSGDCLFGTNSADVQVGIANPTQSCNQWIQSLAGDGLVWYPISSMAVPGSQGSADSDTMQETCDLTDGTTELFVEDGGSMVYGDDICSAEERNGWSPEGTPGPLASQGQAAQQQAAQASASASAAQAQQNAETQESSADAQLQQAVAVLGQDYSSWSKDVATANADYQQVKAEPLCSNGYADQNTYDDAQNVYDDGQSVYDDQSSLTNDIGAVKDEIGTVQSAQSSAGNSNYSGDITAAQAAVSKAQAAVNADDSSKVQSEATAVQTATGNCS